MGEYFSIQSPVLLRGIHCNVGQCRESCARLVAARPLRITHACRELCAEDAHNCPCRGDWQIAQTVALGSAKPRRSDGQPGDLPVAPTDCCVWSWMEGWTLFRLEILS